MLVLDDVTRQRPYNWIYRIFLEYSLIWLILYLQMTAEERISLWSELFNSTFTSFWSSTVTTHPEYWLTWNPLPGEQQKETPRSLLDPTLKVCWQKIIKMFDNRKNFSCVIKSKATSLVHIVCHENLHLSPSLFFLRQSTVLLCCKAFYHFLIGKH